MKHKLTVNYIKSNGGDIGAENNFVRSEIESINDIDYEAFVTKRQLVSAVQTGYVEIDVPAGSTMSGGSYLIQMQPTYEAFGNNPTVLFKQYISGDDDRSPATLQPLQVNYQEICFNGSLQLLSINFPQNEDGNVLDRWMVVIKS